jgi:hypothetical protein
MSGEKPVNSEFARMTTSFIFVSIALDGDEHLSDGGANT